MKLPTKLSEPMLDPLGYSSLGYGPPKIGKTSLFAKMDYLYADFERGTKAIRVLRRRIRYWDEYLEVVGLLMEGGYKNYKGFVNDTVDRMYNLCFKYVCTKAKIDHPSDEEYGKGWDRVRTEFLSVVSDVCRLPIPIVFLSHSQVSNITTRSTQRSRISPRLTGVARTVMLPVVDTVFYVGYGTDDEDKRYIHFRGTELIEAGTRMEEEFKVPKRVRYRKGDNWATIMKDVKRRKHSG